jgi:hypothetical protein
VLESESTPLERLRFSQGQVKALREALSAPEMLRRELVEAIKSY